MENGNLSMTRRPGEKIIIGTGPDQVVMTVVAINGGQAKISFSAPRSVSIDRSEVRERKLEKM